MTVDTHPSLFDPPAAAAAKSEAIEKVELNAAEQWKVDAFAAVKHLAETRSEFTADDVWERLLLVYPDSTTHQPSALGPIFLRAARQNLIRNTHMVVPTKIARRHRDITVWKSLVLGLPQSGLTF